jgi:hypothetical protein
MIRALLVTALLQLPLPAAGAPVQRRGSWDARLLPAQSYVHAFGSARRALAGKPHLVQLRRDLPTIVIPDLHGRRDYLDAVLGTRDPASGRSYLQLLHAGQVQVLCLGDVMHSETRGALWRRGMPEPAMRAEMAESLGTLKRIAELKAAFPDHFHLLRGNHDDVGPACEGDTCRLPLQIAATRSFLTRTLGAPLVRELAGLFSSLPLAATGKGFCASHADPMLPITRREVEAGSDRASASLCRGRVASFDRLRNESRTQRGSPLQEVARALGVEPSRGEHYVHGHIWARPMAVNGCEVYFGHPADRTFVRLDPGSTLPPWQSLFEAGSGRAVCVPAASR